VLNRQDIGLFLTPKQEHPRGMLPLVDWFLGRLNNKEVIDFLHLHNSNSNLVQGQMRGKLHQKAATIAVLIVGVQIISSGIVRGLRNLTKGKVQIKVIKTRVKGR
jgi:hypothetical protein